MSHFHVLDFNFSLTGHFTWPILSLYWCGEVRISTLTGFDNGQILIETATHSLPNLSPTFHKNVRHSLLNYLQRICHDFPWYLPISFGAKCIISGNQSLASFADIAPPKHPKRSHNLSLLTLFIPKVMFKDGQITQNSMTHPCLYSYKYYSIGQQATRLHSSAWFLLFQIPNV